MARLPALRTYRKKRDFARTPEPSGEEGVEAGRSYVIQKHAARRLHHDFRLELDGVLKSWAVPKGPPVQPGGKVLAVRTEDHPLAYGGFEGVIPPGEYGGGTVMLWDRGTWRPEGDARAGLRAGKLDFVLEGERLRGRWSLVRMGGRAGEDGKENWLLIKRSDDGPGRTASPGIDESVSTGRSMAEIAAGRDAVWKSGRKQGGNQSTGRKRGKRVSRAQPLEPGQLPGARKAAQPRLPAPQLATLVDRAPDGDEWLHEIKFDGYRLLAVLAGGKVRLLTRTGQDWTARFQRTAAAIAALPVDQAVLDGEVVVLRPDGVSDFQALQNSLDRGDPSALVYFAFDLPHCGGFDLRACPLLERKRLLEQLLGAKGSALRYSEHVLGNGPVFLDKACGMHLEGIVSKRADAPYQERRTRTWLKSKCLQRQEFVIGGWTDPEGSRARLGALLLGVHEDGALHYAGRVGTGFTGESLAAVARKLAPLATDRSPFVDPPRGAAARSVHWVRPEAVAEVAFTEWTGDGLLRHPSFQGLREDKPAAEVRTERARPVRPARREAKTARRTPDDANVAGVRISHPERVLYPDLGLTKLDLARYYERVAERLLPYLVERPLSVVRCPDGTAGQCFFQKHLTAGMPKAVRGIRVQERSGSAEYIAVADAEGLLGLVQFGVIEFHPWGSRGDLLDRPDRIVIDLDPAPDVPWAQVVAAALRLRELLAGLQLESFARTTGGKGLHVVVPIERRSTWAEVKTFARELAAALAREQQDRYVLVASKRERQGRIFVDYLRNDHGATAVASWSARARAGATVAMPLRWQEVTAKLDPGAFTVPAIAARLKRADPWAGFADVRQSLTAGLRGRLRKT